MKKTLTLAGLGACVLLVFPSCSSTDNDGFSGSYEEALPMSTVGDDELPPWLLEDSSDVQVDAGDSTIVPAPEEPIADAGGKVSTSQNQPNIAATDDVIVDTPDTPAGSVDPLSGTQTTASTGISATPGAAKPATTAPTAKPGSGKRSIAKAGGTKSGKSAKKGKKGKKLNEPTLTRYKVRKGDNLSDIAKRSRTTVAQIRRDSGIKGDLIYPGQEIVVLYTPKDYKKPIKSGKNAKGAKNTGKGKSTRGKNYTVRRGETISGIAKKNGVSTADLLKANNMKASDAVKMRAGQKLIIPKR